MDTPELTFGRMSEIKRGTGKPATPAELAAHAAAKATTAAKFKKAGLADALRRSPGYRMIVALEAKQGRGVTRVRTRSDASRQPQGSRRRIRRTAAHGPPSRQSADDSDDHLAPDSGRR